MNTLLYIANLRMPTEKAYGIQITKMCEAFARLGVHVELLLPTRRNPISADLFGYYQVQKNFKIHTVWSPDFYWRGKLDRIAVGIKEFISSVVLAVYAVRRKADVIFSRDEMPLYLLSYFKRNLVFEAHKYSPRRLRYYRRFRHAGMKIVAISNGIRNAFIRSGFKSEQVIVAHDGVDLEQFVIQKTKHECRELLGLPQDKVLVVYTGHLYEWKGAHVLAEAAKNLDERFVVMFVGGTQHDISQFKKRYENHRNMMFVGWRPHSEIPLYLKAADFVVLPNSGKEEISRAYTSPLKMFEYMASGTLIIAADLPAIREVLSFENAFLFVADDPVSLSSAIADADRDSIEAQRRVQNARHAVAQYAWSVRAERIIMFIKQ